MVGGKTWQGENGSECDYKRAYVWKTQGDIIK